MLQRGLTPPPLDARDPLDAHAFHAFDRRLARGAGAGPLMVALSGGSDSLALLHLVAAWARGADRRVVALTVDHGLSPHAAGWTRFARETALRAGADWAGVAWTGPKPAAGLPAAARRARHALLAEAARAHGGRVLLLGHTADDVAEGESMRAGDAPGLGRLRPWGPSPAWPQGRDIHLLRPLLGLRRRALRDWLRAQGEPVWVDDPANADARYARARARSALAGGAEPAHDDPLSIAAELRALAERVECTPEGGLRIARTELRRASAEAARALARRLATCAGGGERPAAGPATAALADALRGGGDVERTLAGARVAADAHAVLFAREAGERRRGARADTAEPLAPGTPTVWDGRFALTAPVAGLRVDALAGHAARLPRGDRARLAAIAPLLRPALPVWLDDAGAPRLPAPFGEGLGGGDAEARALVGERLRAACGCVRHERELLQNQPRTLNQASGNTALSTISASA